MPEKICLFAGTSDGRALARHLMAHCDLTVCVATEYGQVLLEEDAAQLQLHTGRMDQAEMTAFFQAGGFSRVLDATHPYAAAVTENLCAAASAAGVPYLRILRENSGAAGAHYVGSAKAAADYLSGTEGAILLTTGSKELSAFSALPRERIFARVLPFADSLEACARADIPPAHIYALQGPFSLEMNMAMLHSCGAAFLVTKASGAAGGFAEKLAAAEKAGVQVVLIGRPAQKPGLSLAAAIRLLDDALDIPRRPSVTVAGMGPGGAAQRTAAVTDAIAGADCLIGAPRLLEPFRNKKPCLSAARPEDISAAIHSAPQYDRFVVLLSGDTGFYSAARRLPSLLLDCTVQLLPGVSAPSYFTARLGIPWDDIHLMSLHGREEDLPAAVRSHARVLALTGGRQTPAALCAQLCRHGLAHISVTVGQRLSYPDEHITSGTAEALCSMAFDPLSVLLAENPAAEGGARG